MKLKFLVTLAAVAFAFTSNAGAEDKHNHDKIKAGPTGGKLITAVEPHVEFFVNKDQKVEIRFVDDDNKVVAPGEQAITATLGDRAKPTKLVFTKDGDKLVSDQAVPAGNDYPIVVQIKATAKGKAVNAKFNLNLSKCPSCANAEYACACDHSANAGKKGAAPERKDPKNPNN